MADNTQPEWQDSEPGHPAFKLLSIVRTIWKRKYLVAVAWVILTSIGVGVVRLLPAVYVSEAVILVDTQKIPEKFVSATVATALEDRIEAIKQTLLSGGELKKIIDEFGLYREARKKRFEEEILDMMRKDISITLEAVGRGKADQRTAAFRIGYQGSDPLLVMRVANRLTDLYVEQNLRTREGQAEGTSQFIDTQLVEAKKRLDGLEAAVSAYKLQHNGELPQQEQSLASALSRLQTELEANRDAINRAQQTRVILEGNLNAMEATVAAETRKLELTKQAAESNEPLLLSGQTTGPTTKKASVVLQEQLDLLRSRYSDKHPDVIRLKANLEKVKSIEAKESASAAEPQDDTQQVAKAVARAVSPVAEPPEVGRTREQIAGLKAQIKASDKELEDRKADQQRILRDLDAYQRRLERLPVREQEMAQITRDYEMSKENYKSLLDKKLAAEMALDMERRQQSERFNIVDRAQLPEKPIKPNRLMLYGVSLGAGLLLGLVVGFAAELRSNVVLGEWELPDDTPVLARLPYIEVPFGQAKEKSKTRRWFGRPKKVPQPAVGA